MINDESSKTALSLVEVLEHAIEGGLLRLVVSKPVQQAIGRLVYGACDVPVAYLEGWAQQKRSETLAEKQITSAIAGRAKVVAASDQTLVQRGIDRWTRKADARQKS